MKHYKYKCEYHWNRFLDLNKIEIRKLYIFIFYIEDINQNVNPIIES